MEVGCPQTVWTPASKNAVIALVIWELCRSPRDMFWDLGPWQLRSLKVLVGTFPLLHQPTDGPFSTLNTAATFSASLVSNAHHSESNTTSAACSLASRQPSNFHGQLDHQPAFIDLYFSSSSPLSMLWWSCMLLPIVITVTCCTCKPTKLSE